MPKYAGPITKFFVRRYAKVMERNAKIFEKKKDKWTPFKKAQKKSKYIKQIMLIIGSLEITDRDGKIIDVTEQDLHDLDDDKFLSFYYGLSDRIRRFI